MSSFINRYFKIFAICLVLTASLGCANDYEKLKEYFYSNENLAALQVAEKGLRKQSKKQNIETFLEKFGDRMATRSLERGKTMLENSESKDGLLYLRELNATLEGLIELEVNVAVFKRHHATLQTILPSLKRDVIATEETLGSEAYRDERYIKAVKHFRNVLDFDPSRSDIQERLSVALEKGKTHFVITKFYAHSKSIPDTFSDEFKTLLNKPNHSQNELKESALIRGVNVTDTLRHKLVIAINKTKNEFVSSSTSQSDTTSKNIEVRGVITAYEEDTEFTPQRKLLNSQLRYQYDDSGIKKWDYAPFEYSIYEIRFAVNFSVSLQLISNGEVIDTFSVDDVTEDFQRCKGDEIYWSTPANVVTVEYPPEYERLLDISLPIDKEFVIKEGIERCAIKVAEELTRRLQRGN